MPTEQEVLEYLADNGLPKEFSSKLRDDLEAKLAENKDLKDKAELYDKAQRRPLIEQALKEAKVDVQKVAPKVLEAIQNELADADPSSDWASQMATDYGLPIDKTNPDTPAHTATPAAQMVDQALGSQGTVDQQGDFHVQLKNAKTREEARAILQAHGQLDES